MNISLEQARAYLTEQQAIVAAYLFDSVAKDRARAGSDVDIAVLLREGIE